MQPTSDRGLAPAETELVEAFLGTSRALVGVAMRSLGAGGEDLSLPQFRILVTLSTQGPQRVSELATLLGVNSSTATRHVDRLSVKGLLSRSSTPEDGRAVAVSVTRRGRRAVNRVLDARRGEIKTVLAQVSLPEPYVVLHALHAFASALGEQPDRAAAAEWGLGSVDLGVCGCT